MSTRGEAMVAIALVMVAPAVAGKSQ